MRIRKLELQGFKSFVDRTTFHFGSGVSGVVGPNGCGKSNIVDAVRWCIGEQSAKSLRGDSMADVIFAGSTSRPAVGMAEVSIDLAADGEPFPGMWEGCEDVEITRRLYRDGRSEYLINRERVRLRDVHEFFMDTGIGNQLYAFIEQGRVGQIVHARPEQRRLLIEEAAGITRFKVRREETEQRLAAARESLEKVADRADEMGRQLRSVERQVQKIFRYRAMTARLRQEEVVAALSRFGGLVKERHDLSRRLNEAQTALAEDTRAVERNEQELSARRSTLEKHEEDAGQLRDRLSEIEGQRRVEESAAQYQSREHVDGQKRLERLQTEQEEARAEREQAVLAFAEREHGRTRVEQSLETAKSELQTATQRAAKLDADVKSSRHALEQSRRVAQDAFAAAVRARANKTATAARRQDLALRRERQEKQAEDAKKARAQIEEMLGLAAAEVQRVDADMQAARKVVEDARAAILQAELARIGKVNEEKKADQGLSDAMREREKLRARLEVLEDMQRRQVDVPDGLKAALSVPGVIGMLAQELDVSEQAEGVLSRALDGALETVLVPNIEVAKRVITAVSGSRARVLVVPSTVPAAQGFATTISGSDVGRAALCTLLPHLDVATDLADAFARHRPGVRVVTATGLLIREDGLVVLGGDSGAGTATLRRRREIASLKERLAEQESQVLACRTVLDRCREALRTADQELNDGRGVVGRAGAELRNREAALGEARHRLREAEADRTRAQRLADGLVAEARAIEQLSRDIDQEESGLDRTIAEAEQRQIAAEEAVRAAQAMLEHLEGPHQEAQARLQVLQTEVAAASRELTALRAAERTAKERTEQTAQRVLQLDKEKEDLEQRLMELVLEAERTAARIQELSAAQEQVREDLEARREQLKEDRERVRASEAATKAARERRDRSKDNAVQVEATLHGVRTAIERVSAELQEKYGTEAGGLLERLQRDGQLLLPGFDPGQVPAGIEVDPIPVLRVTPADLERDPSQRAMTIADLRDALQRIGAVNFAAEEEYKDVSERHTEIEAQRKDLHDAMEIIEKALTKLNRTCRERFRETFELVDARFREVYPRLTGGGTARLELVNDDDLLTCGVDVIVQPPGKRIQNLTLLSGGEKAMAAIALIFALFQVRPSPFCILDEVDAPLDEANGARFNETLRELATRSQFIVVTHNKKTMEAADTLYGVTMPEPGTSRLVTVKIE